MANNFARTVTGLIVATNNLNNTASGNPMWDVEIMDMDGDIATYRTSADVSLAWGLNDRDDLRNTVTTYGLTRAGRLNGYTKTA